jgi:hypothetical protein
MQFLPDKKPFVELGIFFCLNLKQHYAQEKLLSLYARELLLYYFGQSKLRLKKKDKSHPPFFNRIIQVLKGNKEGKIMKKIRD